MQGQVIQQLLTAATRAYSPAREHRVLSTAAQNRGSLRVKQDAARTLTCGDAKLQAGVGAVGCGQMPFGAVQRRSGHPVAPNLLPRSGARDRVDASRLPDRPAHRSSDAVAACPSRPSDANARSATVGLNCSRSAPTAPVVNPTSSEMPRLLSGRSGYGASDSREPDPQPTRSQEGVASTDATSQAAAGWCHAPTGRPPRVDGRREYAVAWGLAVCLAGCWWS